MKIKLSDIPHEGLDLHEEVPSKVHPKGKKGHLHWFEMVLRKNLAEIFPKEGKASLTLHLQKTCRNVAITGQLDVAIHPVCSRCAESFPRKISAPLKIDMAPYEKPENAHDPEEIALNDEDENFSFYHDEQIDLSALIQEQILLEIPIREICREDCKGLCARCGQDLNKKECVCTPDSENSPFKSLKGMLKKS
ncbi:MAG: DUF177 domain-containing protein [bacterium]|nr:DUF177 domain-containing protein [bacterium]